jgi:hypothetical protein
LEALASLEASFPWVAATDRKDVRKDNELEVVVAVVDSLGSRVEVEDSLVDSSYLRNTHKEGELVVRNHMEEDMVLPLETTMAAANILPPKVMATLRNLDDWMDPWSVDFRVSLREDEAAASHGLGDGLVEIP